MDITIGKMASWVFGVLLILSGLGALTMSVPAAVIYFLTGLFLIPNVRQEIDERYDVAFSRWVVILIAVIGIGLGGTMMQGNIDSTEAPVNDNSDNQQPSQDTDNQEQTSDNQIDDSENEEGTKESRTHSIGSEFTVGDVRYQVNDVSTRQRIGESVAGTFMGAEANGQFLIVDMSVMNEADESIRMRTSSLKLMVGEAEYSPDTEASVYMDNSFTFEQLNPGVQVDGQIAYDVPESTSASSAELKVNPVGLFSTEEPNYVTLG